MDTSSSSEHVGTGVSLSSKKQPEQQENRGSIFRLKYEVIINNNNQSILIIKKQICVHYKMIKVLC